MKPGPVVSFVALCAALGVSTAIVGWWTVPLVAAAWSLAMPRRGGAMVSALAGAISWGAILAFNSLNHEVGRVAAVMGEIVGLPPWAMVGLTLAFSALLAGSAALVVRAFRTQG